MSIRPQTTDPVAGPRAAMAAAMLALALGLAAAYSSWAAAERADAVPDGDALGRAAAAIAEDLQSGDGLALLPAWAAAERWRFDAVFRARDLDLATAWVPADPPTAWDVDGLQRLWLVRMSRLGPAVRGEEFGRIVRERDVGDGVEVALVELAPSETVQDLRATLGEAEVARLGPRAGVRAACRWNGQRHVCDGAWWTDVFVALNEVGSTRRRCIFAQPHPGGATLQVRWPAPAAARSLQGRFGNRLWAVRYDKGSDVAVRVRIGGEVRHESILSRGDFTWHAFEVPLATADHGQPIAIEFSAADTAWRQLCFDARLVGRLPGAAPAAAP